MKGPWFCTLLFTCTALANGFSKPDSKSNPLRLWYTSAATYWNDSLPIGNGRLGGMVKGAVTSDIVYVNEDSFWSGGAMDRLNPSSRDSLSRIQPWLLQGDISDAQLEANLGISGLPSSMREYMPGGDFQLVFQNQSGSTKDYERWLDVGEGTAGLYYTLNGVTYMREYLSSNPAGVIAIHLTASSPGALSFYVKFQRPSNSQNRFAESAYAENGDTIVTKLQENQITAYFAARVKAIGGTSRQIGDQIQVIGADEAWIYADMETTVREDNPLAEAKKKLAVAMSSTYPKLRQAHVSDHQSFFNRTSIFLGASSDTQKGLATDARRQSLASGSFDPEFLSLYYQFGRYMLIASSREGTYPPNLQGIWNNDLNPAWGSKYTVNINLEMNYWPSEVGNLGDLTSPLFDLMTTMYESGKTTAKQMYNARGWCAHHNTDIWGDTAPQDISASSAYWPMASGWLLEHVFEHYLFTGDKDFLTKHWEMMRDAAQFFVDFLQDYKGWKVTNPSLSPENSYKNGSVSGYMTVGSTIDNSILWELFGNLQETANILGENEQLLSTVATLRSKLPPLRVSPTTGALMEWIEDFSESDPGHRHMSPLYGLYPGHEITPENKTIWDAAATLLKRRVDHGSGSTGWSRAWIASLYARLYNGASVQQTITTLLYNYTYNSLLNTGPPAPFQIDGNFGGCAAVAESLLQSHNGVVNVLPARMPSSRSGSYSGLVARGGFEVGATWVNEKVTNVTILSKLGNALNLTVGTGQVLYQQGGRKPLNATSGNATSMHYLSMSTKKGASYTFLAA